MKFSNGIVSAEEGSFIMVYIIRITWKVDNSDTRVATNEVRCAQNDDAVFRILNSWMLLTTTEIIKNTIQVKPAYTENFIVSVNLYVWYE